jgi:hypothetical protein
MSVHAFDVCIPMHASRHPEIDDPGRGGGAQETVKVLIVGEVEVYGT